jgi:hypothetical protein
MLGEDNSTGLLNRIVAVAASVYLGFGTQDIGLSMAWSLVGSTVIAT